MILLPPNLTLALPLTTGLDCPLISQKPELAAGHSWAMPNGRNAAKQAAKHICGRSNDDGGVGYQIKVLDQEGLLQAAPQGRL